MDGSTAAIILIPIVVTISVAAWLIVVFYADSHPQWRNGPSPEGSNPVPAAWAQTRPDALTGPTSYIPGPGQHADVSWSVPAQSEQPEATGTSRPEAVRI